MDRLDSSVHPTVNLPKALNYPPVPIHTMADIEILLPDNLYVYDEEAWIELALDAYQKSQSQEDIANRDKLSLFKAAKLFDVPRSTLTNCSNGVKTHRQAYEHQQNLTAS